MTENSYENEQEIDPSYCFPIMVQIRIFLQLVCFSFCILRLTTQKILKAIFEIQSSSAKGFNLSNELGTLASLAGFGGIEPSSSELLIERIMEREFILEISDVLSLKEDPFFQPFDPNHIDPLWKARIKNLLGLGKIIQNEKLVIESRILGNYREYVSASPTEAGATEISVTHENPKLAAKYANQIMEQVRQTVINEDEKSKETHFT